MVSENFPYLNHKHPAEEHNHEDKDHTIWLPPSSHLERPPDQPGKLSNQYSEIYPCPACGLVCEYRPPNVHYDRAPKQDPNPRTARYAAVLRFQCGECTSESHVLIRKSTTDSRATNTLAQESKSWTLGQIHCPKGHLVTQIPSDAVARTDKQLGLI